MTNLLKAEHFKLIRSRVFWVLVSILVALSFLLVFLVFLDENGTLEKMEGVKITAEVSEQATEFLPSSGVRFFIEAVHAPDLFITVLLISILGSFLIATESSTGVMKNIVSIGYRRSKIYLAKTIVFSLGSVVLILLLTLLLGVF